MACPLEVSTLVEQRSVVRFLLSEGEKPPRIFSRLTAQYGESCMSRGTFYKWVERFKNGGTSVTDEERYGAPVELSVPSFVTGTEGDTSEEECTTSEDMEENVALNKTENQISKLNKIPKGRKTVQLGKKTIKAVGREKSKLQIQIKMNIIGEKYLWFRENLEPVENYTPELLLNLIEKYLGRFDEELQQIKLKGSIGEQKERHQDSREDTINMTIKNERNEFLTCGIEIPDILNKKQLNLLRNWSGELRCLQNFKTVRYTKGKLEHLKKSSKPEPIEVKQEKMETGETSEDATETNKNFREITIENNVVIKDEVET